MATSLAETYYLKALENYPWELSEVMENLTYSLSYDEKNAAANCLMGQLQANYLKNYREAERYYELAIMVEPGFGCAYENLVKLYIHQWKLVKAQKVLEHAQNIPTVRKGFVLWSMAMILERRAEMRLAKRYLNAALAEAVSSSEQEFLEAELERVKARQRSRKRLNR